MQFTLCRLFIDFQFCLTSNTQTILLYSLHWLIFHDITHAMLLRVTACVTVTHTEGPHVIRSHPRFVKSLFNVEPLNIKNRAQWKHNVVYQMERESQQEQTSFNFNMPRGCSLLSGCSRLVVYVPALKGLLVISQKTTVTSSWVPTFFLQKEESLPWSFLAFSEHHKLFTAETQRIIQSL